MDIDEVKKLAKNKIEAEALTKQVRGTKISEKGLKKLLSHLLNLKKM